MEWSGGFHTDRVPARVCFGCERARKRARSPTHCGCRAADKNTNERSQVENVSTVVLIDLTDTSSVSQRRQRVTRPLRSARARARVRACVAVTLGKHTALTAPPILCISFTCLRSQSVASTCLSSASVVRPCEHSTKRARGAHVRAVLFQRLPYRPNPGSAVPKTPPPSAQVSAPKCQGGYHGVSV